MESFKQIHERAVACAKRFLQAEAELLGIIQTIEAKKIFRDLGYSSVFQYVTEALKLSESQAYSFISVARKAKEVPALKKAIVDGRLNVCKAKRIVSVINHSNSKEWIEKAITLPFREVEKQVARLNPSLIVPERIHPVAAERMEFKCGISAELEKKIRRVQDVLSQKRRKACGLEESLEALVTEFLDRHDPVQKAKRAEAGPKRSQLVTRPVAGRKPLPAALRHKIQNRDQGRCTFEQEGKRCESQRWLEIHHKHPVSLGGSHTFDNLVTLCWTHHKHHHESSGVYVQKS